jgi:hypothetical protein
MRPSRLCSRRCSRPWASAISKKSSDESFTYSSEALTMTSPFKCASSMRRNTPDSLASASSQDRIPS